VKTKFKITVQIFHRAQKRTAARLDAVPAGWTRLCLLGAVCLAISAPAATWTWTGGAVPNANWNNSANWGGSGFPGNGDTVIFSGSHTNAFVNTNNIANLSLNQIQFVGDNTYGVMFDLRGNAFTLTGGILATNVTGTNIIENYITLPNAYEPIVVSNSDQLIIEGELSGPGGVTKAGHGTLTYQCAGNNTYTNTTLVSDGILQFNVSGENAVSGPLVIGDGTGTAIPMVEDLQSFEMDSLPAVTINENGELMLNNFNEPYFTTNLTMGNGTLQTGSGTLTLLPNPTITFRDDSYPTISGNINLNGGQLTLQSDGGPDEPTGYFPASLGGTGNLLQTSVGTVWYSVSTYAGNFTAKGTAFVDLSASGALGNITNTLTLDDTAYLVLQNGISLTNQSLTINSTASPAIIASSQYAFLETNSWTGSFIFNTPCTIDVWTNITLSLNGPISGAGSVTKIDSGRLVYTGANANTYTGGTIVAGGSLQLGKSFATVAVPGPLYLGANTIVSLLNSYQINSPYTSVTLSNSSLLNLAGYAEWLGPISLQGAQITTGAGLLYLGGNLTVNSSTVAQSQITGNAIIWNGTMVVTNTSHNYSPDLLISANLSSGPGVGYGLIKDGAGEVSLAGNNTFTGPVAVNNGNLWAQTSTALGSTNYSATVNSGGELFLDGSGLDFGLKPLVLNGAGWGVGGSLGALICNGSSSWEGSITLASSSGVYPFSESTLTLAGVIGGPGAYTMDGPGTNMFSGSLSNSYAGTTTVSSGTLLLNKPPTLPAVPGNLVINSPGTVRLVYYDQTSTTADILVNNGGLFDLASNGDLIDTLRGTGTVHFGYTGYIEVGWNNGSSEFDGYFTGIGFAGLPTIYKEGTGTFTMGGNSSFTSGYIDDHTGELVVNGYAGDIPVTVDPGATLGGAGTVGELTANGLVEPGTLGSHIGQLTSGDVTFGSGGNFTVVLTDEFDGPGLGLYASGPIGTNTLGNATLTVVPAFTAPLTVGQQFVILDGQGFYDTDAVSGTFQGLPGGTSFKVDGIGFKISYPADEVVLTVTSLPSQPDITGIQLSGGLYQLDGSGTTNLTYTVWASTNLATTNWVDIGTATVPANTNIFQFTDTNTLYYADRFYRFTWP
jgi:autotransporter-associated beta strand protein